MATTTLTQIPQLITVSGTTEHDINFDDMLDDLGLNEMGTALVDSFSGTVQFNANNVAITAASGTYTASGTGMIPVRRGIKLRYKGGAGSETFNITIFRP